MSRILRFFWTSWRVSIRAIHCRCRLCRRRFWRRRGRQRPKRVAYSADLGITPVDPEVAAITRKAAERFAEAGAAVEEAHPDLSEAHECFRVLRAFDFAVSKGELLRKQT